MFSWCVAAALAGPLADRIEALDPEMPLVDALEARVAIDQEARLAFHHGLPPEEEAALVEEIHAIDAANVAFLERLLDAGWVTESQHGEAASRAAWLLAQHADAEPELQQRVLARLERLLAEGEVAPRHVAYLHDRLAVNAGEAQRYGTQGTCAPEGWSPASLEDPEAVDRLRAELGLAPLAVYARGFDCDGRRQAARDAYEAGEHAACAEAYAAVGARRSDPDSHYNAACCAALAGDTDTAFAQLEAAWAVGFTDLDLLEGDSDLDTLRTDDRWAPFVADHQPAVVVALDPRIELLHVLGRLAGFEEFQTAPDDHEVLQAVDAWFRDHRDHDAVTALAALRSRRGVGYNAVSALGFLLDDVDTPALRQPLDPFPAGVDGRLDAPEVAALPDALARFVDEADWAGWRAASAGRRERLERVARALVHAEDPQAWFDGAFPAVEPGQLLVVPEIIAWQNNYAGRQGDDRYIVLGSLDWAADGGIDALGPLGILVHEMAHAYAGTWLDAGATERLAKPTKRLFKRVRGPMARQAYPDPAIVLDESLTRAITQLYLRERHPDEVEADIDFNDAQHFYWVGDLADALARHRSDDGAIDLDAAEADIVAVLTDWSRRPDDAFRSRRLTVNGATGNPAYVLLAEGLHDVIAPLADRFWSAADVRTPGDALPRDGAAVVYGSPADTPLVVELLAAKGLVLDATGLALDDATRIDGDDLRVIFAVEHDGRPWAVYTAWDPARIRSINMLFHGPFGLTVGRGDDVILER